MVILNILDSITPLQSSTNRGFDCSPGQKKETAHQLCLPSLGIHCPQSGFVTSDALKYLMANHRILALSSLKNSLSQSPMGITAWLCMESPPMPPMPPMFIMAKTARDRGRAAADGGRVKFWKPKARRGGRGPFLEAETE